MVENSFDQLGISPDKIIVTGDSAGGHLAICCAILSIIHSYKVPTGVLAFYPALHMDANEFFPSILLSMDDPLLTNGFLSYCISSFINDLVPVNSNYIASPYLTPEKILEKFPKTEIYACQADPLRD